MGRLLVLVLGLVVLGVAVALASDGVSDRRVNHEIDALLADGRPPRNAIIRNHDVLRLPDSVQRWFRYSKVIGTAVPTTARLRQQGQFPFEGRGWVPFETEQYIRWRITAIAQRHP